MGFFSKKNPYSELASISNHTIMFSKIDEYSRPILFFPYLLSEKSDSQVSVYKIPLENLNSNFKEFTNQFLNKYNSLYKSGLESPRPEGQRFSLDFWPNHTVAEDHFA